jgi:RCC1 and BTB domain-containing protein
MDFEENLLSPKYIAYSWGKNEAGELSHGNTKMALLPREVKGCTRKPRQISSAKSSSALVNSEGCLFLTGSTLLGKLGFK